MRTEPIAILPIGNVPDDDLADIASGLKRTFNTEIKILAAEPLPSKNNVDGVTGSRTRVVEGTDELQYFVGPFLKLTQQYSNSHGKNYHKVLGVTDVDIYTRGLNFIFGQAEIAGRAAIIATARLKYNLFWSLGRRRLEPREVFVERIVKEAVHELGHTFGLRHCKSRTCVMTFSNCLADTDFKSDAFCDKCKQNLP